MSCDDDDDVIETHPGVQCGQRHERDQVKSNRIVQNRIGQNSCDDVAQHAVRQQNVDQCRHTHTKSLVGAKRRRQRIE